MELGLNLSFAVKRWQEPEILARMCKNDFSVNKVQFTWDLINPWWPEVERDFLAKRFAKAFADEGIEITSSFAGLAAYNFANFLSPTIIEREIALKFFKRSIDMALVMDIKVIGSPIGGMSNKDAYDLVSRKELYQNGIEGLKKLAEYGKDKGLERILIEATPLETEFPSQPDEATQLMEDLKDSAIPFSLLIDWGHALYKPLLKEKADMELWLSKCKKYVDSIHIQQTDGLLDRHWGFDSKGLVTPELIKQVAINTGTENIVQYLEIVPAFETFDSEVYKEMKTSMKCLRKLFDK